MIEGMVAGKIFGDPEARRGKGDSEFVVAKVRAQNNDGEVVIVNVIVFAADLGAVLMDLRDGDAVALAGSLAPKVWSDKQGNTRPALDMVATRILAGAYTELEKE
jgi:single-stranded DNA-binding protein